MANDFTGDSNCKALWNMEETSGVRYDSKGGNDLADNNSVLYSTDAQQGTNSADFESTNSEYLSITDANLDSGFPLKTSESNLDFSICFWLKKESLTNYSPIVCKEDYNNGGSFMFRIHQGNIQYYCCHGTTGLELLDGGYANIAIGRWYHIGITYESSTKNWKCRIFDNNDATDPLGEGTGVVHNGSGTATNTMGQYAAPVTIGTFFLSGAASSYYHDGLIDEVVVFDDILTTGEIDQIRSGIYVVSAGGEIPLFMHHFTKNLKV